MVSVEDGSKTVVKLPSLLTTVTPTELLLQAGELYQHQESGLSGYMMMHKLEAEGGINIRDSLTEAGRGKSQNRGDDNSGELHREDCLVDVEDELDKRKARECVWKSEREERNEESVRW
jgi:hypothetical protein